MRNVNLLKLNLLVAVFSVLLFSSCKKSQRPAEKDPVVLDENLIKSPKEFASTLLERETAKNVFSIQTISRRDNLLTIVVKGGSTAEDFQVIWQGIIMESYPMQTRLILRYKGDDASFDQEREIPVKVNLQKLLGTDYNASDFIFHVENGSTPAKISLNPNGSTSR